MHELATTLLALFLVSAAFAHFLVPSRVETLIPEWWPWPRATVYLSGVVEVLLGVGLLVSETQRWAAYALAGLFIAYALVHLDDLRHTGTATRFTDTVPGVALRGLTNFAYAAWAVWVALGTPGH